LTQWPISSRVISVAKIVGWRWVVKIRGIFVNLSSRRADLMVHDKAGKVLKEKHVRATLEEISLDEEED
jgi:hypothetical protein